MANENNRTMYPVDRRSQAALVTRLCLHWGLFVAIAPVVAVVVATAQNPFAGFDQFQDRLWGVVLPLVLTCIALVPPVLFDVVRTSNRVVGPVTRLRQILSRLNTDERIESFELREDDHWQELVGEVNELINQHNARCSSDEPTVEETVEEEAVAEETAEVDASCEEEELEAVTC